ncbi:MAG: AzlC family ABC transporter permease [Spirochaetota bacterium]
MTKLYSHMLRRALSLTFPVFLGYIPLGMAFGVLLVKAGYPWYLAPFMAVVMYAGSGQLLAVSFFSADAGYPEIAVATALMQLRHAFYGLSLLKPFSAFSLSRIYMMHGLTDETYALLTGDAVAKGESSEDVYFLITLFDHIYWILGCTLGAVAGSLIPYSMKGLDFALAALFTVLAVEKFLSSDSRVPFITGIGASIVSIALFGRSQMLLGAIGVSVVILMMYGWMRDDVRE